MKKILSIVLSLVIAVSFAASFDGSAIAKTKKLKKGIYYNSKKKIYMQIGSSWDEGNECTVYVNAKTRPGHLDSFGFKYKKGKLKMEYDNNYRTVIIIKSKKKFVWKGKKKEGTSYLNGKYKYKKKGSL